MDQGAVRKASVKCLVECQFLTIPASAFVKIKEKLLELNEVKKKFLNATVPGMKDLPQPGPNDPPHASFFFEKMIVEKDHPFLKQGNVEENAIYVVIKGIVELRRNQDSPEEEVCDSLSPGNLFGTLPHEAFEPLTAIAASDVEVWAVKRINYKELPPQLLNGINRHLSIVTAHRLKYACVNRQFGWEAQQLFTKQRRKQKPVIEDGGFPTEAILNQVQLAELQTSLLGAKFGEKNLSRWRL